MNVSQLTNQSIELLKKLIATPSISGEEEKVADHISDLMKSDGIEIVRKYNNIYAHNTNYDSAKPTLLLNSHHDTVKPVSRWTSDPFKPVLIDNKLIGLGSNDAGASLVSLLAAFRYFKDNKDLNHNLIFAATAEEENSGEKGIRSILSDIGSIDLAIVGEPTGMQMAIAEKGLMVLRCQVEGVSGHAARGNGDNAILKAIEAIKWFSAYRFPSASPMLGEVKMTVTMINAGLQHNIIPDVCDFTVDVRTTEIYRNESVLKTIKEMVPELKISTSLSLQPSSIPRSHNLVQAAEKLNISLFGSPTLSDQALISAPSVKIGPGMSERSHTADEFVYLHEIEEGIKIYINLLDNFLKHDTILN